MQFAELYPMALHQIAQRPKTRAKGTKPMTAVAPTVQR
jgi:hypothetical protein